MRKEEFDKFVEDSVKAGVCPYSGDPGPECKSWLCDCFEFEDVWGVSQK